MVLIGEGNDMPEASIAKKMIDFYAGSLHDIEHFLKVHAYASMIGKLEGLDRKTQKTLEIAAIVHDIACPLCREKYGAAYGNKQETESEALLRPFLAEFPIEKDMLERIVFLVSHHHTTEGVDGVDYRILLEADFLVNASEGKLRREAIEAFCRSTVRTETAKRLFDSMYLR